MNTFVTVSLHVPINNTLLQKLQSVANRVIETQKDSEDFELHIDALEEFDDLLQKNFEESGNIELLLGFVEALNTLK